MNIRKLVGIAVLTAIATATTFLSVPLLPHASFLKFDVSDSVLFVIALRYGMKSFLLSSFLKGSLIYLFGGDIIGAFANIAASVLFVVCFYVVYKKTQMLWQASMVGTLALTVGMTVLNCLIFLPLYLALFNIDVGPIGSFVWTALVPFNLLKGSLLSCLNGLIVKQKMLIQPLE